MSWGNHSGWTLLPGNPLGLTLGDPEGSCSQQHGLEQELAPHPHHDGAGMASTRHPGPGALAGIGLLLSPGSTGLGPQPLLAPSSDSLAQTQWPGWAHGLPCSRKVSEQDSQAPA